MEKIEKAMKEYNNVCDRIRSGEYDDLNKEIERYNKLKSILDKEGVMLLDGLDLDNIIR